MLVGKADFNLFNQPVQRQRSGIRDQLSARKIMAEKNALNVLRRFPPPKYAEFLSLCDKIFQQNMGEVELVFTSSAEMFSLDFASLTDEQIKVEHGILDFRVICEALTGGKSDGKEPSVKTLPVVAPPLDRTEIKVVKPEEAITERTTGEVSSPSWDHPSNDVETYLNLRILVNGSPALNFANMEGPVIAAATEVVENCIGVKPPREEMREHVILVSRSAFVGDGERMAAFATARYFEHFRDRKGNKEQVTLLWGTMVGKNYRRLGLMVKLNYDLMNAARQAAQEKVKGIFQSFRRTWIKAPQVVRTQNIAVFEASRRYMKGVKRVGENPSVRHQSMIAFVAQEYAWTLDGSNVQREAYPAMRVDNIENLIPGLGPREAYVFAGDFTWGKWLKMWFDVKVLYPLRVWLNTVRRKAA